MKKVIVLLIVAIQIVFTQDTNIVKYFPLKTGNVWIYNYSGTSSSGKIRLKITDTIVVNGHLYYNFQQNGEPCTCSHSSYSPFLVELNAAIRIDSLTGNIFWNNPGACSWHNGESLLDSLNMTPVMFVNASCYTTSCQDTNIQNIFGNNYPSKYVGQSIMTWFKFRRYVKHIGLTNSLMGCYANTQCSYTLQGCVIDGVLYGDTAFPVGVSIVNSEIPEKFELSQNYPNPFNPVTKIKFQIPLLRGVDAVGGRGVLTQLTVYDALGKEVQILVNQLLQPGSYEAEWDASAYPSGVYYYKLIVETSQRDLFTETKKMVLIK